MHTQDDDHSAYSVVVCRLCPCVGVLHVASIFQGCGLSPEFFAQGIRGLLRDLRVEAATGSSPLRFQPT